jgi:hypothetical protein
LGERESAEAEREEAAILIDLVFVFYAHVGNLVPSLWFFDFEDGLPFILADVVGLFDGEDLRLEAILEHLRNRIVLLPSELNSLFRLLRA